LETSVEQRAVLLRELFQAGVSAVGGYEATFAELDNKVFKQPIYLVALGKAADAMARGAMAALGHQLVSGFVVSKHGGTSALVEYLDTGISLAALKEETDKLLAGGAPIGEINRYRRTLSRIKGGKLSRWARCSVLQLLISDVPGDKPGDIGSGLLIPDESTGMAVQAAAIEIGLTVRQQSGNLHGQMPEVVDRLSSVLLSKNLQPGVYIWGGEPTIVLPDKPGRGGRNQHLALAMSEVAARHGNLSLLVCGTDGTDGPTTDAGGLVSQLTVLVISEFLASADAGSCLSELGALVTTGPTGTNVMDLAIAVVG